jgi:hypothetical protein
MLDFHGQVARSHERRKNRQFSGGNCDRASSGKAYSKAYKCSDRYDLHDPAQGLCSACVDLCNAVPGILFDIREKLINEACQLGCDDSAFCVHAKQGLIRKAQLCIGYDLIN